MPADAISAAGIDPRSRAEQLQPTDFVTLARRGA
jgi:16S rRNA A1518/A1519 N6-dimethyltransferase RsmA/KsgA/DIM1 with predicted DNA glycosylase/AP lyase activity